VALQRLEGVDFLETENDQLLAYVRRAEDNVLIVCVNLDPRRRAKASPSSRLARAAAGLRRSELLSGDEFHWRSAATSSASTRPIAHSSRGK
jgi:starch synthase (maltosyl-transferring)